MQRANQPEVSVTAGASLAGDDLIVEAEEAPAREEPSSSAAIMSRRFGRDALIYGIGMFLSRAASFVMLPVYTRMLTTTEYGLLQMLDMTIDVVAILVSAGMLVGVMRFYFKATTDRERQEVVATAYLMLLALNLLGSLGLAALANPVWRYALHGAGTPAYVRIAAANFTVTSLSAVPLLLMQIRGRATLYISANLTRLGIQLSLNLFFLVVLHKGPGGILMSTLIASVVVGTATSAWLIRQNGLRFSRKAASDLRRFGVPYQIATAGSFVLTFGDRFFLDSSRGLAAVGVYGFAYQFGFLMDALGRQPYQQAWNPRRYAIVERAKEFRDRQYNKGFFYLSAILVTVGVGLAVLVHPTLRVMSKPAFLPAADLVPIILAAYLLQTWGDVAQFGINVSEQTKYSTIAIWISVGVVLGCYAVLIPLFGGLGAAIATFAGFLARFACLYVFAQRLWKVDYDWTPHLKLAALAGVTVIISRFARMPSISAEIGSMSLVLLAYATALWTLIFTPEQRQGAIELLVSGRQAVRARLSRA